MLTGQETYNSTSGIKLDNIITWQEQYISTVGNNLVQVAAHPLLRLFLYTNGGVTTRIAAVVRRHEGRKQTTSGLEFDRRDVRRYQHHHSSRPTARGTDQGLTDDLVYHRDITRPSSRYGGGCFPLNVSQSLPCLDRPRRLKSHLEGEKTAVSTNTFSTK